MDHIEQSDLAHRIALLEQKVQKLELLLQHSSRSNATTNDKMHTACYLAAKSLFEGNKCDFTNEAEKVHRQTSMKVGTAKLSIMCAYALLTGELFKSAISAKAADIYLTKIQQDFGDFQLKKAILALRNHIQYRRSKQHNVDRLEQLCNSFDSSAQ